MVNDWTDSWEEYFARQFRSDVSFVQSVYGEDAELADLTEALIKKVDRRQKHQAYFVPRRPVGR